MSGEKYSRIRLEEERRAKKEALTKISTLRAEIEAFKERTIAILNELPEGVKESFRQEIEKAEKWLKSFLPPYSDRMESTELRRIAERLDAISKEGKNVFRELVEVKEKKRYEKEKAFFSHLEILKGELSGFELLLKKWNVGALEELKNEMGKISSQIERGELSEAEKGINRIEEKLKNVQREVTNLEQQDEVRRFVLESLRKVCKAELGWGEEGEPHSEDEKDPKSAIIYKVDTYGSGKITFYLRLQDIKVNSEIPTEDEICYKEFQNLSDRLRNYGVLTEFEQVNLPGEKPVEKVHKPIPVHTKIERKKRH